MKNEVLETELGSVEYISIGKGIPILFIHGGHSNCHDKLCLKGFDPNKFRLIVPSRPGYSRTPLENNKTPRQAAALFMLLLDHLGVYQAVVYGISAGGLTAIELAGTFSQRVSKLVLASSISKKWLDEDGQTYKTAKKIFNPKIEGLTWWVIRLFSKIMPGVLAKSFHAEFTNKPVDKLDQIEINELVSTLKVYRSQTGFLNDMDQDIDPEVIKKIECPTLIIHSENDKSVDFDHAEHAQKMIKNSKLIPLQNDWGHLLWIGKDSTGSINIIISFIAAPIEK